MEVFKLLSSAFFIFPLALSAVINQPVRPSSTTPSTATSAAPSTAPSTTPSTETLDKMYERLRNELKVPDTFTGHSEINKNLLDTAESNFAQPIENPEIVSSIPKDIPFVDKIDPELLPPKPQRATKGFFGKLAMNMVESLQKMVEIFPYDVFNYFPYPEPASYISPRFDPAIHPPLAENLYPAPEKKPGSKSR